MVLPRLIYVWCAMTGCMFWRNAVTIMTLEVYLIWVLRGGCYFSRVLEDDRTLRCFEVNLRVKYLIEWQDLVEGILLLRTREPWAVLRSWSLNFWDDYCCFFWVFCVGVLLYYSSLLFVLFSPFLRFQWTHSVVREYSMLVFVFWVRVFRRFLVLLPVAWPEALFLYPLDTQI